MIDHDFQIMNGQGKLFDVYYFFRSEMTNHLYLLQAALVDLHERNLDCVAQAWYDCYVRLYHQIYHKFPAIDQEEPYDDWAEFVAERNPMFENFDENEELIK